MVLMYMYSLTYFLYFIPLSMYVLCNHTSELSLHDHCIMCKVSQKKVVVSIFQWLSVCNDLALRRFLEVCLNLTLKIVTQKSAANCLIIVIATKLCDVLFVFFYCFFVFPSACPHHYLMCQYSQYTCIRIIYNSYSEGLFTGVTH